MGDSSGRPPLSNPPHGCGPVLSHASRDARGTSSIRDCSGAWEQFFIVKNCAKVVRGMHAGPNRKLVTVVSSGSVFDVLVDARTSSPTYGRWWGATLGEGESLVVAAGVAHGYFSEGESAIVYAIEGSYDARRERCWHYLDPAVGIRWPDTLVSPIVSERDSAAPPLPPALSPTDAPSATPVFLVYGASGFVGAACVRALRGIGEKVVVGAARLQNMGDVEGEIAREGATAVVSCVGVGGSPCTTWHDENEAASVLANVALPLALAAACRRIGVPCVMFGSGVVEPWSEAPVAERLRAGLAPSNAYERLRLAHEALLAPYLDNTLLLRIMFPITGDDGDPRCLVTKVKAAAWLHDGPSNVSVLPSLLQEIPALLRAGARGVLNFVNPGPLSPLDIAHACRGAVPERRCVLGVPADAPRCNLSTERLGRILGRAVPTAAQALEDLRVRSTDPAL
jgi:dTDP-4-dehydrorhamnose 3,5-epimerase-like enzyme/nucleoside-diphosphate-sugar epimerase